MFRLLVVEDLVDFYEGYLLRIFQKQLPMETISLTHVATLEGALQALQEPWSMILMDYSLGGKTELFGDPVRDGADLVALRRAVEETQNLPKAFILGISGTRVGNRLMQQRGADEGYLKLEVVKMAEVVQQRLDAHG